MSEALRQEFNQWVRSGRSAGLESHHRGFLEQTIPLMNIGRRDRILDVGCGEGWATRMLAGLAPEGSAIGLDVSDEMIHRAREHAVHHPRRTRLQVERVACRERLDRWHGVSRRPRRSGSNPTPSRRCRPAP